MFQTDSRTLGATPPPHALRPDSSSSPTSRRSLRTVALAALSLMGTGVLIVASSPTVAGAATSGWSAVTVPGTGGDDVLLGTACASANECFAAGVSLGDLASAQSTKLPLLNSWNGSTWTLGGGAALPADYQGGLFDVACPTSEDCWAVGTQWNMLAAPDGNPTAGLAERWNGTSWTIVPTPVPSGAGIQGAVFEGVSCASASDCFVAPLTAIATSS